MGQKDPKLTVLQFNECINNRDIEGLASLMAETYVFIDSSNTVHQGKAAMAEGWRDFFARYPDYRNHFSIVESSGNLVLVTGHSTCSYEPLDGPAPWTAKVEDKRIAEWRIYLDMEENRKRLKIQQAPPQD